MAGTLRRCAFIVECLAGAVGGLVACSSDAPIATTDASDRADAPTLDAPSEMSFRADAAPEGGTAGTCGAVRWNARYGGSPIADAQAREEGYAITADRTGNVFVTGTYGGDADFGGGARPGGPTNQSTFLVKLDPAGAHLWSKGFVALGGGHNPTVQGYALATDVNADVALGGYLAGVVDFGGGALKSAGAASTDGGGAAPDDAGLGDAGVCVSGGSDCSADGFVAKYDAQGAHLWSRTIGAEGTDTVRGVAFDGQGNVYVVGGFEHTISLGGPSLVSAGKGDGFVAKLDPQGHHLWSVRFGGVGDDVAVGVAIDSAGNAIVSAVFSDTVALGPDSLTTTAMFDGAVAKLDAADGHIVWAKSARGSDRASIQSVAVDKQDQIALLGIYQGSVDMGLGTMHAVGSWDTFVARLGPDGKTLWAKSFGSDGYDSAGPIAVDQDGHIFVAGQIGSVGGVDFGGGLIGGGPDRHAFALELDATSAHVCSRAFGGPAGAYGVAVDPSGRVILTGAFSGQLDVGLGPLVSTGGEDIFVAAFGP